MILARDEILKYLPHRDPFLFIDEVISIEEGNNIHASMNIKDDDVSVGAHTLITKNIKNPGNYIGIMPAQNHVNWSKSAVFIKKRGK